MAGRGPAPDTDRLRRGSPSRGDWTPSPDGGWQHDLPEPPSGISPASAAVWDGWFRAWWAGNWTPDDLPALRFVIRLYDRVGRGDVKRAAELRQWLDGYGITPKGQQDRRWARPKPLHELSPWERRRREEAVGTARPLGTREDLAAHQRSLRDRIAILQGDDVPWASKSRFTKLIE